MHGMTLRNINMLSEGVMFRLDCHHTEPMLYSHHTARRAQEDEVYDLQFGNAFAEQAVDPRNGRTVLRDDFALEIADMDE